MLNDPPKMVYCSTVTEDFLQDALICYRQKYGTHACIDNYTVYFEPTIGVFEVI